MQSEALQRWVSARGRTDAMLSAFQVHPSPERLQAFRQARREEQIAEELLWAAAPGAWRDA